MPARAVPCGAVQKKRSVFSTRVAASARLTQRCSTPIGYAVRAKPVALTLANERVGQRSGVRPLCGSLLSQKKRNVRAASVSRKTAFAAVRLAPGAAVDWEDTGGGLLQPARTSAAARQALVRRAIACHHRTRTRTSGAGLGATRSTRLPSVA